LIFLLFRRASLTRQPPLPAPRPDAEALSGDDQRALGYVERLGLGLDFRSRPPAAAVGARRYQGLSARSNVHPGSPPALCAHAKELERQDKQFKQ
jgi:hypothetical protein